MKKILLTGKDGQVGWELQRTLATLGKVIALDQKDVDFTDHDSLVNTVRDIRPDIIVNPAAYTAVDKAESEFQVAMSINGTAPGILAEEAKRLGATLVHYSTDYIFNGQSSTPYLEYDNPDPINQYGFTKLAGEKAIQDSGCSYLIIRTSWVYGARGKNFLLTMLKLGKEKDMLRIVNDQIGAPTWSRLIAQATAHILAHGEESCGVYNLTTAGKTSWCDFAKEIFRLYNSHYPTFSAPNITGISSHEYPTPAKRPFNSVLSNEKIHRTFGLTMPNWDVALELCLNELIEGRRY